MTAVLQYEDMNSTLRGHRIYSAFCFGLFIFDEPKAEKKEADQREIPKQQTMVPCSSAALQTFAPGVLSQPGHRRPALGPVDIN
ncbi:hypothetical protein AOLI_G00295600 [Acnodon oligacanthus]